MIVYCDTSAVMKVYATEQYSDWTEQHVKAAKPCIVSQITWVEMCAALSLKARTHKMVHTEVAEAMVRLRTEWPYYSQIAVDDAIITAAGELAQTFGLRAYDSLQLASAQRIFSQAGAAMAFCCFDRQLNLAASALGMAVLIP